MNQSSYEIVRKTILGMERPFNVSDLFYRLKKECNVTNRALILEVLEDLCENDIISYSEIQDDCWAFRVTCISA